MIVLRTARVADEPRLRALWKLAFGDEDAYIDHFFTRYYAPKRMLVLERAGVVLAMTAWFDMPLVRADGASLPAAYLYAVATHPDCRGQGLAGKLLDFAGQWLAERGFLYLTTVPARPDLHVFFGKNGFSEGFALSGRVYHQPPENTAAISLVPVDGEEYGRLREAQLAGRAHVSCSTAALDYQQGVCALSGGGLYRVGETGCACVEVSGQDVFVKELLVSDVPGGVQALAARHPADCYHVRMPWDGEGERWDFAMLRPLVPLSEWGESVPAYFGLAFD